MKSIYELRYARVPSACAEDYPKEPWACLSGSAVFESMRTPVFITQALFDPVGHPISGCKSGKVAEASQCLASAQQVQRHLDSLREHAAGSFGLFTPACIKHVTGWRNVTIQGVTWLQAFEKWMYG